MEQARTRYPGFDLLKEQNHWDQHTREIVLKRLGPFSAYKFLTPDEAKLVRIMARHIVYDHRQQILDYCLHYLDTTLASPIGEDQRQTGTPEQKTLVREGLKALEQLAQKQYAASFINIDQSQQLAIITTLATTKTMPLPEFSHIPPQQFFKKIATLIVSAYYAHPTVWSEIGFGGPAYPRGYIRVEKGLTDPWEAKTDVRKS